VRFTRVEVIDEMNAFYECPDCNRTHDEPATAALGLHVRCLDCELERNCDLSLEADLPDAA
jgi:hypothetical protein